MSNPFHVKFSFSDDNFSKPTANLEMRLVSSALFRDRSIKQQQYEDDWGESVAFLENAEPEPSD